MHSQAAGKHRIRIQAKSQCYSFAEGRCRGRPSRGAVQESGLGAPQWFKLRRRRMKGRSVGGDQSRVCQRRRHGPWLYQQVASRIGK